MNPFTSVVAITSIIAILVAIASLVSAHDVADHTEYQHITSPHEVLRESYPRKNAAMHDMHTTFQNKFLNPKNPHPIVEKIASLDNENKKKKKMSCGECQTVVSLLESITANKTMTNDTLGIVNFFCESELKNKTKEEIQICKELGKVLLEDLLPALFKGVKSLAWNVPLVMCADVVKVCKVPCCLDPNIPEQIFLSFADAEDYVTKMRVTWVVQSLYPVGVQKVQYKIASTGKSFSVNAEPARTYENGGWEGYIYSAVMSDLPEDTKVSYSVGSDDGGYSKSQTFKTLLQSVGTGDRKLRVVFIADAGWGPNSNNTLMQISRLIDAGKCDMVSHNGDIGYADGQESGWDWWMRKYSDEFNIGSRVPTNYAPGNHEFWWNFSAYKARLGASMPSPGYNQPKAGDSMFHLQRVGTAQFIFFDSETWFDTPHIGARQVEWATNALTPRTSSAPWLVSNHHRPLYCTSSKMQCGLFADILKLQVEDFYLKEKTDLVLVGHLHSAEVSYPVAHGKVQAKNFSSPSAPVHIVGGWSGNREGNSEPKCDKEWDFWCSKDVGFTYLEFSTNNNKHSANISMIRSADATIVKNFVIDKTL